jgi:hypothetical protein
MAKRDYYDDPEEYWRDKEDRDERDGIDRLQQWERRNPNHVYGQSEPKPPKDE